MEKFVVSARKYRPATFDTVVGQSHITTTLKNAIRTNHLAQAFLFCGPRGVGKTTCARILAKTINCQNLGDDIEPCNECDACKSFNQNASFNIHELDAASNNSVEDIRNLIDQVRFPPQTGHYKVYIIDEVHMLSTAAFNAFLKTLEEPPSYAIFILATTEKHKILPTILSRCQIFDFNRIKIKDMADHLESIAKKEGISTDYQALELIAQKADGGLRDALSMFDLNVTFSTNHTLSYSAVIENLHILDYDYYFRMTDCLVEGKTSQAFLVFHEILEKGFDGHQFVVGLNEHFRNLMVCKDAQTVKLLEVSESVQQRYLEQSSTISLSFLMSALSVGSQVDINYKSAKNQRLHVEIGLMKLSQINQILDLTSLPAANAGQEKKNTTSEPTVVYQTPPPVQAEPAATKKEEPKPEPEAAKTSSYSNFNRTPSKFSKLKSTNEIEESILNPKKASDLLDTEYQGLTNRENAFTLQELQKAWNTFTDSRGKATEEVILRRPFTFENNTIHLLLDNQVQYDLLNDLKQEIASYLRNTLQNSNIQITAEINIQQVERRPYTAQEKFEFLANKNPALWELKEKLGLDLIF